MYKITFKGIVIILSFLLCITLPSCDINESLFNASPEVDFSVPQNVQVSFNDHIYDIIIVYKNSRLEINFVNEKDLMDGAYIVLNSDKYKISYNNMIFEGDAKSLTDSFMPCILYSFLRSFEGNILLDLYNNDKCCHYIEKNVNSWFVALEAYEKENVISYSIEIK